jgi:hypothetical protein
MVNIEGNIEGNIGRNIVGNTVGNIVGTLPRLRLTAAMSPRTVTLLFRRVGQEKNCHVDGIQISHI